MGDAGGGSGGRALTPADIGTDGGAGGLTFGTGGGTSGACDTTGAGGGGGVAAPNAGMPPPRCAPGVNIDVNSPGAAVGGAAGAAATGGDGRTAGGPVCTSGVGAMTACGAGIGGGGGVAGAPPIGRNICVNSPGAAAATGGVTTGAGAGTGAGGSGNANGGAPTAAGNGSGSGTGADAAGTTGDGGGTVGASGADGSAKAENIAVPPAGAARATGAGVGAGSTVRARSHGMKVSRPSSARVITAQPRSVSADSITSAASGPVSCATLARTSARASGDASSSTCASTGSPVMRSTPMNVRTPSCCAMTMDSRKRGEPAESVIAARVAGNSRDAGCTDIPPAFPRVLLS